MYMLSPWMEQGDMTQFLKRKPGANRLQLLLQIAEGLRYLHTNEPVVVHGDLKCENIFISESEQARLADFGLSHRAFQGGNSTEGNSDAWHNGGNPRWQAPELLKARVFKEAERTTASDMFAFGRVIIETFTGDVPFANIQFVSPIVSLVKKGILPDRPTDEEVILRGLDDRMWEIMKDCSQYYSVRRLTAQGAISRLLAPPGYQPEPQHGATVLGRFNSTRLFSSRP